MAVRSCAQVASLRDDGVRTDADSVKTVDFGMIADPAMLPESSFPRIGDASCLANENTFADFSSKQS